MSKNSESHGQNNDQSRKKKIPEPQQQKQAPVLKTPSRKLSQYMPDELFNLMSPFQLPPKFNNQFTATPYENYGFSNEMRVFQTPLQQSTNTRRPAEIEDINHDLRQITGKIDWDNNTPAKSKNASSDEEDESQNPESSGLAPEQNDAKSQISEKQHESQENPQKITPTQTNKQFNAKTQRQRHLTKRICHQKKLLEQFMAPEPNSSGKKVFCNCKKTKCLKLYCDCFRINQTCEGCNCQGCHNLEEYAEERNNAILVLMDRNPDPFSLKIHEDKHLKGCNCKKSFCLKKYCECFQAGLKCGENCKCDQCKNGGGSQQRQRDRIERDQMMMDDEKEKVEVKRD